MQAKRLAESSARGWEAVGRIRRRCTELAYCFGRLPCTIRSRYLLFLASVLAAHEYLQLLPEPTCSPGHHGGRAHRVPLRRGRDVHRAGGHRGRLSARGADVRPTGSGRPSHGHSRRSFKRQRSRKPHPFPLFKVDCKFRLSEFYKLELKSPLRSVSLFLYRRNPRPERCKGTGWGRGFSSHASCRSRALRASTT